MVQKLSPHLETRKVVWILALSFALIATFQFVELPYSNFLSISAPTKELKVSPRKSTTTDTIHGKLNVTENSSSNVTNDIDKNDDFVDGEDFLSGQNSTEPEISNKAFDVNETTNVSGQNLTEPEISDKAFDGNETTNVSGKNSTEPEISDKAFDGNETTNVSGKNLTDPEILDKVNGNETTNESLTSPPVSNSSSDAITGNSNTSVVEKEIPNVDEEKERPEDSRGNLSLPAQTKEKAEKPVLGVYTLSDMDNLLTQSRESYYSVVPRWSSPVDKVLRDAMTQIENAPIVKKDPNLYAPLYRNVSMFKRSYELMESTLKVYVYKEGARPILHTPYLSGLYASEGWFMKQLESNAKFVTKNPKNAHLFYLPFSSRMLEQSLYVVGSHSHKNLIQYLKSYVELIAGKYPHWNRTGGADHFLAACHDWAPSETRKIMSKCIRALCNSDVKEGFVFGKDVSLPETLVRQPKFPLRDAGGKPPSKRTTLAFFAGSMHGYLRPILLQHWQGKDPDVKVFGKLPKSKGNKVYSNYMKSSKYCICAKGYEVNSPRVVESIFYECVPVIISDNFVPPFFGVLNWQSFAVFVAEKDIPELKKILSSIPEKRYLEMQANVKRVQRHFLWHVKPEKYDIFHMILHNIWYNRLHQIRPLS